MSITVNEIIELLEYRIPTAAAAEWDNVGLMLGRRSRSVNNIMLALDLTDEVVKQALEKKAEFILTHHPAIFRRLAAVTDADWQQELLLRLAEKEIAVYSAHTNLDTIVNGVNYSLGRCIGLQDISVLDDLSGIGSIGCVEQCSLEEFASYVKGVLNAPYVVTGNAGRAVHRVAICGGAGSDLIDAALAKGADTMITGDVKYHEAQKAVFSGMNIIDAGHQSTEFPVLEDLAARLAEDFNGKGWNVNIFVAQETYLLRSM